MCLQQACTDNSHTIDGSSTVYPLTREAAEFFEKSGDGIVSLAYSGTVTGFGKTHKLVEDRFARLTTGTIFNVPSIADAWLDLLLTQ